MEKTLLAWNYHRIDSSPALNRYKDELNQQRPFMGDFKNIKTYFDEHKSVPRFRQLKSESPLKDELLFGFKPNSIFVTVHIRQRAKEIHSQHGGALYRDSNQDTWLEFIKQAAITHPQVVFIVVGRLAEFTRQLYACNNVIILKHYGLGLIDELTAIQHSDLFMGGISGPAMFAMFTNTPYVLFQSDSSAQEAAKYFNENIGEESPFFALDTQKIKWLTPTVNDLNFYLEDFINNKKRLFNE
jgi:ADP-heptose:LPS heptosyltransferase